MYDSEEVRLDLVSNNVTINLNMLGMIMKDRIMSNVKSKVIVTM